MWNSHYWLVEKYSGFHEGYYIDISMFVSLRSVNVPIVIKNATVMTILVNPSLRLFRDLTKEKNHEQWPTLGLEDLVQG